MTILPDAVRAYEQELLQKAEMLALGLKGLRATAPDRAAELLEDIVARLEVGMGRDGGVAMASAGADPRSRAEPRRLGPGVGAARGGGAADIEDFIIDIPAENPVGLSGQEIVSNTHEAPLDIK